MTDESTPGSQSGGVHVSGGMVRLRSEKSHSFRDARLCGTNSWWGISKNDVRAIRSFIQLVLLSCLITGVATSSRAQSKKLPVPPCQPLEMMRRVYQGDLTKALAQSEACVASNNADIDSMSKSDPPNPWLSLAIFNAGYYQCVEAQILAMMGSLPEAESALSHAEAFALSHPDYLLYPPDGMGSVAWRQVVSATKGFVLEKKGDFKGARLTYLNAQMDDRLALLALNENDKAEAWSRARASAGVATSLAVLGALYELDGDNANAFLSYSEAQKLMEESFKPRHNDFKPMNLSESQRVSDGLRRLGAVRRPSH